jgi:ribulose-5-phosphate 4-epimerase/fuculose-1-phosphate aldolase
LTILKPSSRPITETSVGSKDVANIAAKMLREYKIFMLRGHGCFSIGPVLEEAYQWCSSLEESCKIYCFTRNLQAAEAQISQRVWETWNIVKILMITKPGKNLAQT